MHIELGFGETVRTVEIPDKNIIEIVKANDVSSDREEEELIRKALAEPIGSKRLRDLVFPGEKTVIITSDITRPMPTYKVMPLLLDELYMAGLKPEDITLIFALGSHRKHTEEEKRKLAGVRAFDEIRCVDGDAADFVHMGETSRGTPADFVRIVAEADKRICLGNIEYHYFAGYSGGAKAIMPGVSTFEAIQANHSMMTDSRAHAGNIEDNPIRLDIEEAAGICGVDFILNVILDEEKRIIHCVAGDAVLAHRAGCNFLDKLYKVEIPEKADIVIVSQGGAPKDLNLYQTQKALDNAKHAVKKGGTIILVGSCREGFGNKLFEEWMRRADKPEDLVHRIKEDFKLGGHKAAAIAMVLEKADIYLVSEMEPDTVESIFLKPYSSLEEAVSSAFDEYGSGATVIVMPHGGSMLPVLKE